MTTAEQAGALDRPLTAREWAFYLTLSAAIVVVYFLNLGQNDIWADNEALYADSLRTMLETGNWIDFYFNGQPRLVKPPLVYWIMGVIASVIGPTELAVRLPSAIFGLGSVWLTFLLGRQMFGLRPAFLAAFAMAMSLEFAGIARYGSPDVVLTFVFTLSLFGFYRGIEGGHAGYFALGYFAMALAVLTKGFQFALLIAVIVLVYTWVRAGSDRARWWGELRRARVISGTLAVVGLGALWYAYNWWRHGDLFLEIQRRELLDRAVSKGPSWFEGIFYYYPVIVWSFLPYSLLAYYGAIAALFSKRERRLHAFALVWLASFLVLLMFLKGKLPHYIIQAHPALALIAAYYGISYRPGAVWTRIVHAASIVIPAVVLAAASVMLIRVMQLPAVLYAIAILPAVLVWIPSLRIHQPTVAAVILGLLATGYLLPSVEKYRLWDEIGANIREADPDGRIPLYTTLTHTRSVPYYAHRPIVDAPVDAIVEASRSGPVMALVTTETARELPATGVIWHGPMYLRGEAKVIRFLTAFWDHEAGRESDFADCSVILISDSDQANP